MIRTKTVPLAIIAVATIFSGILIAKSVGYYETTASKEPVKFKTGELAGLPNPADIRGSYTWLDIEKAFGVPAEEAANAFSVPGKALDPAARVSELETIYAGALPAGLEIGTGAVRLFVSLYTGLPFEAEAGSVLPDAALALLATRPGLNTEVLKKYVIPGAAPATSGAPVPATTTSTAPAAKVPAAPTPTSTTAAAPSASPATVPATAPPSTTATGTGSGSGSGAAVSSTGRAVAGKTTYGDLYDWGLTETQVEAVTGFKPGTRAQTIKESSAAAGIEFSTFKTALQALVDKTAP